MKDILEHVMDAAGGRADYADARHVHTREESISTRNGAVPSASEHGAVRAESRLSREGTYVVFIPPNDAESVRSRIVALPAQRRPAPDRGYP